MNQDAQRQNVTLLPAANEVAERFSHCIDIFNCLLENLEDFADTEFRQAVGCLEALPLATGEFALAKCRLANARVAKDRSELGEARFEIRLLVRWMKKRFDFTTNLQASTRGEFL